jgi:hypothetical protein
LFFLGAMPHRYSTVAHWDLAAIRPLSPDLNGHPTLRLWLMIAGSIGHSAVGSGGGRVAGAVGVGAENPVTSSDLHIFVDDAAEPVSS